MYAGAGNPADGSLSFSAKAAPGGHSKAIAGGDVRGILDRWSNDRETSFNYDVPEQMRKSRLRVPVYAL